MGAQFGTLEDKAGVAKSIMALCGHPFADIVDATNALLIQLAGVGSLTRVPARGEQGQNRGRTGAEPLGTGLHIYSA